MLNLKAISKTELNDRLDFRCIHRHNGISHHHCYDQARGLVENIGYLILKVQTSRRTSALFYVMRLNTKTDVFKTHSPRKR
jgi:hypothetical protein